MGEHDWPQVRDLARVSRRIAPEAAVIEVPVFIGAGERDTVATPREEPRAYQRCNDITVVTIPRMAHMHNMASTRKKMWQRIHTWGKGVRRRDPLATARDH